LKTITSREIRRNLPEVKEKWKNVESFILLSNDGTVIGCSEKICGITG